MTQWTNFTAGHPKPGRKIIALYQDGSGASIYYRHDSGYLGYNGEDWSESDMIDAIFSQWAYLPADFEMWCEQRADAPVKLSERSR